MKKLFTIVILPLAIALLAFLIVKSVMLPLNFKKEREARESVAIERLKDIRTLQVAYKTATGKFASTMDSLILFYNTGNIPVTLQIGSKDDSVAVAHTDAIRKQNRKITDSDLYELYQKGDRNLVFSIENKIAVKDTIFASRKGFCVDSLKYVPFSDGLEVELNTVEKLVSGITVPLFEAKMPYGFRPAPGKPFEGLLKGLDDQLIINLNAERNDQSRYAGLMVGSIDNPNNNAGNWE